MTLTLPLTLNQYPNLYLNYPYPTSTLPPPTLPSPPLTNTPFY